jgi:hypothetical protein
VILLPRTLDEFPGTRLDEGICLYDQYGYLPECYGGIVYSDGYFYAKDSYGTFNLRSGGGIDEAEHELLDTLVHDIDETSYDDVIYGTGNHVASYIVWASAAKLLKIREEQYSYSGSKVSQVVITQYDGVGAVKMTMTETYAYSGSKVTSITRTKS